MEGWVDLGDLIAPRPGVEPESDLSIHESDAELLHRQDNEYDTTIQYNTVIYNALKVEDRILYKHESM